MMKRDYVRDSARMSWDDGTTVLVGFTTKAPSKSVAPSHQKLPMKSAGDSSNKAWAGHFDRLARLLAS